jgi:hypothetical protein
VLGCSAAQGTISPAQSSLLLELVTVLVVVLLLLLLCNALLVLLQGAQRAQPVRLLLQLLQAHQRRLQRRPRQRQRSRRRAAQAGQVLAGASVQWPHGESVEAGLAVCSSQ